MAEGATYWERPLRTRSEVLIMAEVAEGLAEEEEVAP